MVHKSLGSADDIQNFENFMNDRNKNIMRNQTLYVLSSETYGMHGVSSYLSFVSKKIHINGNLR